MCKTAYSNKIHEPIMSDLTCWLNLIDEDLIKWVFKRRLMIILLSWNNNLSNGQYAKIPNGIRLVLICSILEASPP